MKALLLALPLLLCAGCLSSPARKAYLVEYEPAAAAPAKAGAPAIRVGPFLAAEPYGAARMLVRDESNGRLHGTKGAELSTPPAVALRNSVRRALAASGRYASVLDADLPGARGGESLSGFVEAARLERRANGAHVYVLSATFRHRGAADGAVPASFSLRSEKPAAGAKPEQQAAAARAAFADLSERLVDRLSAGAAPAPAARP